MDADWISLLCGYVLFIYMSDTLPSDCRVSKICTEYAVVAREAGCSHGITCLTGACLPIRAVVVSGNPLDSNVCPSTSHSFPKLRHRSARFIVLLLPLPEVNRLDASAQLLDRRFRNQLSQHDLRIFALLLNKRKLGLNLQLTLMQPLAVELQLPELLKWVPSFGDVALVFPGWWLLIFGGVVVVAPGDEHLSTTVLNSGALCINNIVLNTLKLLLSFKLHENIPETLLKARSPLPFITHGVASSSSLSLRICPSS